MWRANATFTRHPLKSTVIGPGFGLHLDLPAGFIISTARSKATISGADRYGFDTLFPRCNLQFSDGGLEFVVRYPVEIRRASEVDEQVTKALLEVVEKEPELKASVSATPKIRAVVKG
jgi:hypothetical protein